MYLKKDLNMENLGFLLKNNIDMNYMYKAGKNISSLKKLKL